MAIKNYTTTIKAAKTVLEIQMILSKHGVRFVEIEYSQDGKATPEAVRFGVDIEHNHLRFRLPCNPSGVLASMKKAKVPRSKLNLDHARNVSWRIIKDWIDAQFAIIESGQSEIAEVFFPYILDTDNQTLFARFQNTQLQLGSGD